MDNRVKQASDGKMSFICPGCNRRHVVAVGTGSGPRWSWNGDLVKPTFSPSVLVTWTEPSDVPEEFDDTSKDIEKRCHSFVTNGEIQYLQDCTHSMAGSTVPLPVLREDDDVSGI